jgi:hypothetical protein
MIKIRTWYTFATDVLGYLNPIYRLALGMTRETTSKKLQESKRFLICPKDTRRHQKKIFKSIYHSLYDAKDQIVLPDDNFKIQSYGKIVASYVITLQDVADIEFIKALGPFSLWTIDHILDYTKGKNILQYGVKAGTVSIFLIRIFELKEEIIIHRPTEAGVSNQFFNTFIPSSDILKNCKPVIPDEEFNEIMSSIEYIYSLYSSLKKKNP